MNTRYMDIAIIQAALTPMFERGYHVNESCEGEDQPLASVAEAVDMIMNLDEAVIKIHTPEEKYIGFILFTPGECGWDIICDHTDSKLMNELLQAANELSNKFQGE